MVVVSSGFDDELLVPLGQILSMLLGCYGEALQGGVGVCVGSVVVVVIVSTTKG